MPDYFEDYISVPDSVYMPDDLPEFPDLPDDLESPIIYDIKQEVLTALQDFYQSHIEGSLQIFHSLTLGEILISVLLATILIIIVFKWIWEVVRYG